MRGPTGIREICVASATVRASSGALRSERGIPARSYVGGRLERHEMVGTRRRELAALAVTAALVATAVAPAFVVSSAGLIPVAGVAAPAAGQVGPSPESLGAEVVLVLPTS